MKGNHDHDISWVDPCYAKLRGVAQSRQKRLPWIMGVDELLHIALLRWAPGQVPPAGGGPLSSQQLSTFSLTCRNVLIDELRAIARRRKLAESLTRFPRKDMNSPEISAINRDLVEWALARLPPADRQLLQLRYVNGFSFSEIADRLKRSTDAVRQAHLRALRVLRDLLQS